MNSERNIFDWASEQIKLNNGQHAYKGPIENQRQDYNIKCIELITEFIKKFPNQTFIQILLNCGLLDVNIGEESNATLGRIRTRKAQFIHWDELNFCDGLKGCVEEKFHSLYEYKNNSDV